MPLVHCQSSGWLEPAKGGQVLSPRPSVALCASFGWHAIFRAARPASRLHKNRNHGMDFASRPWLKPFMRSVLFCACSLLLLTVTAQAQTSLAVGTYTETFSSIGSGLPTGWSVFTSASVSSNGTAAALTNAATAWSGTALGTDFRNIASDDIATSSNSATQSSDLNRALGWRPVGSNSTEVTPGRTGAVVFTLNNTTGFAITTLSVRLFTTNDVSSNQTYQFEYRVGNAGNFNQIGSTYTTGTPFGSTTISANSAVLTALTNQSSTVFIRVRGTAASGSTNLDTLGIDDFIITSAPDITIGTQPVSQTVTSGQTVSFSVAATGSGTFTYQWRKGGTNILGATNSTLTLNPVLTTDAGSYDVVISNGAGSLPSSPVTLTVNKIATTVALSNLSVTYDGSPHAATVATTPSSGVTFSVTYNGSATAPTAAGSYPVVVTLTDSEHQISGSATGTLAIAPAAAIVALSNLSVTYDGSPHAATVVTTPASLSTSVTYGGSTTAPTAPGSYAVVATVTDPNYTGTASGTLAIAKLAQTLTFTQPADHFANDAPFTLTASATSGLPVAFAITSGSASATMSGSTLTLTGVTGAVTVRATQPGDAIYNAATLVDRTFNTTTPSVTITTQPAPLSVTAGQSASFSISATGPGPITYQWRKDGVALPGATTTTLALTAVTANDAGNYDALITNPVGTLTSTTATLTVARLPQTLTFDPLPAKLTINPPFALNATASSGLAVTFSIVSGPATLNVSTLSFTGTAGTITVRATQAGTPTYSPITLDRTFDVALPPLPTITVQPASPALTYGDLLDLKVTATSLIPLTYQWRKDGVAIPGAGSAAFAISFVSLTDAGIYDVVVTNATGPVISTAVNIPITTRAQTITFAPSVTTLAANASVILTATASSGLPVTYSIVSGPASISGNTLTGLSSPVVVRASQPGNATTYAAAEPVDRTFTFVAGGLSPFLLTTPLDQTVNAGATVTFRASAIGTPTPTWQWQKDGVAISSATDSTLTLASVTLADAARYTIVATNSAGAATAAATLIVRLAPVIATPPVSRAALVGDNVTFSVVVNAFPTPTLQWRKNGAAISGATGSTLSLTNVRPTDAARYDVVATNLLGSATSAAATLTVGARDFSGDYFGRFLGAVGDFALHVRADGTAVFLGYLPTLNAGLSTLDLTVDLTGNFSLPLTTTASEALTTSSLQPALRSLGEAGSSVLSSPLVAAAPTATTLRGSLNDTTGTLTATVPELGLTLDGTRAARTGSASAQAGFYSAAVVGSTAAHSYAIVAPDGQAYVFAINGATADGAKGTLAANGRLALTTAAQTTVDLGFSAGTVTGTIRTATGVTTTVSGAADGIAGNERLINLSVRAATGAGPATLITGFVITGATSKQVLIRAAGPAIAVAPFNVPGTLADPAIQIFRGNTIVAQNDDWGTPAAAATTITAAVTRVGAFPFRAGSTDSAVLTTLTPGAYTVLVNGGNGTTLAEVYEALETTETPGARRLVNLSARGVVAPGAPLIAGFVIGGTAPQRVLLRGTGPALVAAPFNLTGTLPNPQLTLFNGTTAVKTNDDWFRDADAALIAAAAAKSGAFALGAQSLDAAILIYLAPGAYTVQVTGPTNATAANGTGLALVEIYEAAP